MTKYTYSQFEKIIVPVKKKWWQFWLPKEFAVWNRRWWTIEGVDEASIFAKIMTDNDQGSQHLCCLYGPQLEESVFGNQYIKTKMDDKESQEDKK